MKRLILSVLSVALVAGCDYLRDPVLVDFPGETVVVHSLLHAGSDTVKVLLQQSTPARGDSAAALLPLSGAEVRIVGGGSEVLLVEGPEGFSACVNRDRGSLTPNPAERGCYAAVLPGGVRSGKRYVLTVNLANGPQVTGETTVPAAPEVLAPVANARITVRNFARSPRPSLANILVRAILPPETGALGARLVNIRGHFQEYSTAAMCEVDHGAPVSSTDSLHLRIFTPLRCRKGTDGQPIRAQPDSAMAQLRVVAYDSAYARFADVKFNETVRHTRASAGVQGAFGVFGSAATATREIVLIPEP